VINRQKPTDWIKILPILFLVPSLLLNIFLLTNRSPHKNEIEVIGVVDGDTLVLEGKVRIRLRHVDAPELEYCGGGEAKKELERLVVGKRVRLEEQIPDQYGRSMAIIYSGNTLINKELLKSGWVRYHHDVTAVARDLKEVMENAKILQLGIYEKCQSKVNTANPRCNIKGNIDKGNNAKRYYIPGCAQYAFTIVEKDVGEKWFCTEKEARDASYKLAETCGYRDYLR